MKTAEMLPPKEYYEWNDAEQACFLCGQPEYRLLYQIRQFGIPLTFQKCRCGLIKQTPMPNDRFFEWFYNSDIFFSSAQVRSKKIWGFYDYFKDEPCRLATSNYRYQKLQKHLKKPSKILKIGPATGTFLSIANKEGHHAIGCDISSRFIDYARTNYGVQIDHGRFENLPYPKEAFDAVFLFNVIENIPNPDIFLNRIHNVLKPGGFFILNFVDMENNLLAAFQRQDYFLYRPPICYAYEKPVLTRMLEKSGFTISGFRRDIRYLHAEKILTLLDWEWPLKSLRLFRLHSILFPLYAYPSKIVIAKKQGAQA